jgi:ATP-dependent exoDNAse (exonuclease V) alpha subunit
VVVPRVVLARCEVIIFDLIRARESSRTPHNLLTVQKEDGTTATYKPARLYGVTVYRELEREFAVGDRLSFTAPSKELGVVNRDLGTVQRVDKDGQFTVKMDDGKSVSFVANRMRHFDHGYAVTSHGSQGLTAERVMVNLDSHIHADLVNKRFAYVAVSRGSRDAYIYTDNASSLVGKLSHDVVKSSALQPGHLFATDQNAQLQL